MEITPKEMYQNRLKVIEYLKNPKLRKAKGVLRDEKGGRCCLGHMCDVLNVPMVFKNRVYYYGEEKEHEVAPRELIEAVGLWNCDGGTFSYSTLKNTEQISLAGLNDRERISPQKIGEYLETVIFGGEDTPWRYINPEDIYLMEEQLELFGDDHRKEELKLEKVVTCKKCGCQKTIEEMKNLDHNSCFVGDKIMRVKGDSGWVHTDAYSKKVSKRFAYLPVKTFDDGWIWLKPYYLHEHIYGWGFHDKLPYRYKSQL